MKILKRREKNISSYTPKKHKKKCPYCKSILEYSSEDAHLEFLGDGDDNDYFKTFYITCPVCDNEVEI